MSGTISGFHDFPWLESRSADQLWANWDESDLAKLASDDIFIVPFVNTVAGGPDVGQGCGLTGTDATFVCNGAVPGFTAYGRRNSAGYGWYIPQAVNDLILNEDEWTVILKLFGYPGMGWNTNVGALEMYNGGSPTQYLRFLESAYGKQINTVGTYTSMLMVPSVGDVYSWHYWWRKDGQICTGYDISRQSTTDGIANKGDIVTADKVTTQYTGVKAVGWWPSYSKFVCYYTYLIVARKCLLS